MIKMKTTLKAKIEQFQNHLPYKMEPYSKKNWGHPLHSLCSYQGKLKPSIAYWLIKEFVPEGGSVLDPIGGVGTIPFEASMSGRYSVSNDKSPFASTIAKGKLAPISLNEFENLLALIKTKYDQIDLSEDDYENANFGLNASVKDYYHPKTLEEILKLKKMFLSNNSHEKTDGENFFWSCLLHILHGNRPYALSRKSHPITPFSPTGEFEYKNTFVKIKEKAERALSVELPSTFLPGLGIHGDFRELAKTSFKYDAIITSPPFYGMRFDRPNWLRLWFCGWSDENFKKESLEYLERQQVANIEVYNDFFSMCHKVIKKDGILILHLGKGGKKDMSEELKKLAPPNFEYVGEALDCVQEVANHGIKDKGFTKAHNLLFFTPIF
tara:strand:- start:6683 stop:7828 length:1146 start_codon:yes stop_codon:yes gene_type:complete